MPVVQLFNNNRPLVLVFLPLLVGMYVFLNIYFDYHSYDSGSFGLWGSTKYNVLLLSEITAPAIIFLNAILLNGIFNRNEFMERNSYIVSLLYVVLMSYFHSFYFLDGLAIAQLFLILALRQVFRLHQNEDARKHAFNIALLVGIAASLYPLLLVALPFLFWIIWVFRPFVFRESLLLIIGFILPMIYARLYNLVFYFELSAKNFSSSSAEKLPVDLIVEATLVGLITLLSIRGVAQKMQQGSIRLRKLFAILIMFGLIIGSMLVLEYFFFGKMQVLSMIFIVLMFILPFAFGIRKPKRPAIVIFYLCFLYSVGKFFIPFIQ